jgi:hypothetical protein
VSTWATLTQLRGRLSYATIDDSSSPSQTQAQEWIDEAEATLSAALIAVGLPATYTAGSNAAIVLRTWALDYAEGRHREAWASAQGDDANQDGARKIEAFNRRIEDILANPPRYGELLQAGSPNRETRQIRSHTTDHPDGKSVAAGDFAPIFAIDSEL